MNGKQETWFEVKLSEKNSINEARDRTEKRKKGRMVESFRFNCKENYQ
jgi:hypothetical protein